MQAQSAAAQVVTQAATNQINKRLSSQQAAAAAAAVSQLAQLPQVNQVVSKVSTPVTRVFPSSAQMSIAQSGGQQVTVTQTGQVVTQASGQVAGVVQLPPGVVQLNNTPIVVRPPPPKEMRNKSVQCKPSEDEDQRDSDRIDEVVTGKSEFLLFLEEYS